MAKEKLEKREKRVKSNFATVGVYLDKDSKEYLEELYDKYPTIPRSRFFKEFIKEYKAKYGTDIPLEKFIGK